MNIREQHIDEISAIFNELGARIPDILEGIPTDGICDFKICTENELEPASYNELQNRSDFEYSFVVSYKDKKTPLSIFVPHELLKTILGIKSSAEEDSQKFTENEIKSAKNYISEVLKSLKKVVSVRYNSEIAVSLMTENFSSSNDGIEQEYNEDFFNFSSHYTLTLNREKKYSLYVFSNETLLRNVLSEMQLLSMEEVIVADKEYGKNYHNIKDIKIKLTAILGNTKIPIKNALELNKNSIVELDNKAGEDIILYSDSIPIAEAKMVKVDDYFGVLITKMLTKD